MSSPDSAPPPAPRGPIEARHVTRSRAEAGVGRGAARRADCAGTAPSLAASRWTASGRAWRASRARGAAWGPSRRPAHRGGSLRLPPGCTSQAGRLPAGRAAAAARSPQLLDAQCRRVDPGAHSQGPYGPGVCSAASWGRGLCAGLGGARGPKGCDYDFAPPGSSRLFPFLCSELELLSLESRGHHLLRSSRPSSPPPPRP